jgi:hypothetical protein
MHLIGIRFEVANSPQVLGERAAPTLQVATPPSTTRSKLNALRNGCAITEIHNSLTIVVNKQIALALATLIAAMASAAAVASSRRDALGCSIPADFDTR